MNLNSEQIRAGFEQSRIQAVRRVGAWKLAFESRGGKRLIADLAFRHVASESFDPIDIDYCARIAFKR